MSQNVLPGFIVGLIIFVVLVLWYLHWFPPLLIKSCGKFLRFCYLPFCLFALPMLFLPILLYLLLAFRLLCNT